MYNLHMYMNKGIGVMIHFSRTSIIFNLFNQHVVAYRLIRTWLSLYHGQMITWLLHLPCLSLLSHVDAVLSLHEWRPTWPFYARALLFDPLPRFYFTSRFMVHSTDLIIIIGNFSNGNFFLFSVKEIK